MAPKCIRRFWVMSGPCWAYIGFMLVCTCGLSDLHLLYVCFYLLCWPGHKKNYGDDSRTGLLGELIILRCVPSGARLSGCLCLLVSLHLSPSLALPALEMFVFMCLPIHRWCPALWMSLFTNLPSFLSLCACGVRLSGCLSSLVSFHVSPRLAGGVQGPALWLPVFYSFSLFPLMWLPFWLVVSGSVDVPLHLSPSLCCAFTCLSSRASRYASPNFSVPN